MMGAEQVLAQQMFSWVQEVYLADNHNHPTNSINNTITNVLTRLQENYGQLMPHDILK